MKTTPEKKRRKHSLARWLRLAVLTPVISSACEVSRAPEVLPDASAAPARPAETEEDWAIARSTLAWALEQGLHEQSIGEAVTAVAHSFVGVPYEPGTLELAGSEQLVVNLRTFDCVTLVEHVLVLARLTLASDPDLLGSEATFRERYRDELRRLRYRGGILTGYPSRLHYFSEWIRDAEAKGVVRSLARDLGAILDPRPIHFMTENLDAYWQLSGDGNVLPAIREMEEDLSAQPRYYIPESQIELREEGIEDGDVIAAVSTLDGLDIAHTGIAVWRGDRLHLLHAPLVGDSVEISEQPLAERIQGFSSQMGIMVARPLAPE